MEYRQMYTISVKGGCTILRFWGRSVWSLCTGYHHQRVLTCRTVNSNWFAFDSQWVLYCMYHMLVCLVILIMPTWFDKYPSTSIVKRWESVIRDPLSVVWERFSGSKSACFLWLFILQTVAFLLIISTSLIVYNYMQIPSMRRSAASLTTRVGSSRKLYYSEN